MSQSRTPEYTLKDRVPCDWAIQLKKLMTNESNEWVCYEYEKYCEKFDTGKTWCEDYEWANGPFYQEYIKYLAAKIQNSKDFTSIEFSNDYDDWKEAICEIAMECMEYDIVGSMSLILRSTGPVIV